MLSVRASNAAHPNPSFVELPRLEGEGNVAWLVRAIGTGPAKPRLILVGGRNRCAFRLRVAQSHARGDLTPSHWSHSLLLPSLGKAAARSAVYEVSLERSDGGFPPDRNGLQRGKLKAYDNPRWYPNFAQFSLAVKPADLAAAIERFAGQRSVIDVVELMVGWVAFAWGVGRVGNPLFDGNGIPSSAMVEQVLGSLGMDLTPGLASRSSCPEAIWQSAKWWHQWYAAEKKPALSGSFCVDQRI